MTIILLSDVHANVHALEAVLEDIEKEYGSEVTAKYFLGDWVGYGAHPQECLDLAYEEMDAHVQGNHDGWLFEEKPEGVADDTWAVIEDHREKVRDECKEKLRSASPHGEWITIAGEHAIIAHGMPGRRDQYCEHPAWFDQAYKDIHGLETDVNIAFMGHTHKAVACVVNLDHSTLLEYKEMTGLGQNITGGFGLKLPKSYHPHQLMEKEKIKEIVLTPFIGNTYLFNVGSVGQPRDDNLKACYAAIDEGETPTLRFHRVAYDNKAAVEAIREAGYSERIAAYLLPKS